MRTFWISLIIIMICSTNLLGQNNEQLSYCNCEISIAQKIPVLDGKFERRCNGKVVESGQFVKGAMNGEWLTYSRKGKLIRKVNYDNGLLDGRAEVFDVNSKPKVVGYFNKGKKNGQWVYYTEKGNILCEGSYENNKPLGTWIIKDKKGKKIVTQYDFNSNIYITNDLTSYYKDGDILQNNNTEEWYILRSPKAKYSSKSQPIGGYSFANYIFIELAEIPETIWDTYLYLKYKVHYKTIPGNINNFDLYTVVDTPSDHAPQFTFLVFTNPTSKVKRVVHSEVDLKLIELKIKETLNLMPPWIFSESVDTELYLHYVINQNLH